MMMPGLIGSGTTNDNVASDFMAPLMCWNGNIFMHRCTTLDMILLSTLSTCLASLLESLSHAQFLVDFSPPLFISLILGVTPGERGRSRRGPDYFRYLANRKKPH